MKYLIDKNNFKCGILSTVDELGRVAYSGTLYNNDGEDMQVKDYQALPHMAGIIAEIVDEEQLNVLCEEFYKSICGNLKELTEEKYWDALECLPPMKWHDLNDRYNVFFISEAETSHIHAMFVQDREAKKYFSCLFSRFASDAQILAEIQKINL